MPAQRGNVFANEGTAVHALAAMCLRQALQPARFAGLWVDIEGGLHPQRPAARPLHESFCIDPTMVTGVQLYLDVVATLQEELTAADTAPVRRYIEEPVIYSAECWGTADCLLHQPGKALVIIDLKYGRGVVPAKDNPQLLTYALAALQTLCPPNPEAITLAIVQPRGEARVQIERYSLQAVQALTAHWPARIAAALAEDAPRVAGPHCKYCLAEAFCDARL